MIEGRPLQPVIRGGAPEPSAVSEISHRGIVAHGMRTHADKFIQTFAPLEDDMYFDLVRDPREKVNRIDAAGERARLLKAGLEAAMVENPFRNIVRVVGPGRYDLKLRTGGWVQGVETAGQLEFLKREGCDEVQGYLIGRPLPIDNYSEIVGIASPPARRAEMAG